MREARGSDALRIACGSSVEYLPHVASMLHSVARHAGPLHLEAHFLHGPDLQPTDSAKLLQMVARLDGEIHLHQIADTELDGLPDMPEIPTTMWYRTYLPQLLEGVDRILYLDADVLATDSIEPLWRVDLGDDLLAAVTNVWEPWNAGYPESLGLTRPYFNSGVLLMDLAGLRQADATARVIEHGRTASRLPWGDQDALNVVLGSRTRRLHPRWNCMNSVLAFPEAIDVFGAKAVHEARSRPALRHFEGPAQNKPWHRDCPAADQALYRQHRLQTPWPEFSLIGNRPVGRLRRLREALTR